jgi:hypothetical protein
MRPRDDGIECETCQNELWVCEEHGEVCCNRSEMPCPDCNAGMARGGPNFDMVDAMASDTPLMVDPLKRKQ